MSTTEKMTIHKALCELKVIGDRIAKEQSRMPFVFVSEHSNKKVKGIDMPEYVELMKSAYQSVVDLIARREAIKCAVVKSNATTVVTVGDKQYTVAEAIEMKNHGMEFQKSLLQKMAWELKQSQAAAEDANGSKLQTRADGYIKNLYGTTDMKSLAEEAVKERDKFIEQHTAELVDPLKLAEKISVLDKEINAFMVEVDAALSCSNAITEITITY